jgi:hypothetical protein
MMLEIFPKLSIRIRSAVKENPTRMCKPVD